MSPAQAFLVWSIATCVTYLVATTAAVVILALRSGGRDEPVDDRHALSSSRLAIPVSLIVPMDCAVDHEDAAGTLAALLRLNYPKLEVIVVAQGLPKDAWGLLKDEWGLEARELFYRRSLTTAPVRMLYRSARDPRLLMVDQAPGTPSDALNCGVSLARYRFVSAVEPGVVFDADALLRAMTAPLGDPASIVAATIHIEVAGSGTPLVVSSSNHEQAARPSTLPEPQGRPE